MMHKYPRTPHLEGSRLQPGDHDLDQVRRGDLAEGTAVVEEKVDGANAGISFSPDGQLRLQSRGHYLTGGRREHHFALLKAWTPRIRGELWEVLGDRFLLFGEWLYAKHTVFYDLLPHYFLAFDILDTETGEFLDTTRRHRMLTETPVRSVPVLWQGPSSEMPDPLALVGESAYKSRRWKEHLTQAARSRGLDLDKVWRETDTSSDAEGLYIKVERDGRVIDRLKWVRAGFSTAVTDSETHWLDRPILPNQLHPDADIF